MSTTTIRGAPGVSFLGFIRVERSRLLPRRIFPSYPQRCEFHSCERDVTASGAGPGA